MTTFEYLDWDSDLFGFGVARLVPDRLDKGALVAVLDELRRSGVALVYWTSDGGDHEGQAAARELGGFLADRKTTFLRGVEPLTGVDTSLVRVYDGPPDDPQLEDLAIQSAEFSRFCVDPRMPPDACRRLYRRWIYNSVTGEIADGVLIIPGADDAIGGMVTVGTKSGRGDIGLIAVAKGHRGAGFGTKLVAAAINFHRAAGLNAAQVVTQGQNKAACQFYESCGYSVESVQPVWHFWL